MFNRTRDGLEVNDPGVSEPKGLYEMMTFSKLPGGSQYGRIFVKSNRCHRDTSLKRGFKFDVAGNNSFR